MYCCKAWRGCRHSCCSGSTKLARSITLGLVRDARMTAVSGNSTQGSATCCGSCSASGGSHSNSNSHWGLSVRSHWGVSVHSHWGLSEHSHWPFCAWLVSLKACMWSQQRSGNTNSSASSSSSNTKTCSRAFTVFPPPHHKDHHLRQHHCQNQRPMSCSSRLASAGDSSASEF